MLAFVNDRFIKEESASIGISDLTVQRGFGIFDFFRTAFNVPLFLEDYLDRFYQSANALQLELRYSRDKLKAIVYELIDRNCIAMSGVKMILTGGYSSNGFDRGTPNLIITQQPVEISSAEDFEKGLNIILHEYMRDLPLVKSINYLMALHLQKKIAEKQAGDVLYTADSVVFEFPRSNVFIVTKDESVVTPGDNVLRGITRMKVLEVAGRKYKTEERTVTIEDLKNAAEVFLTSTTKRILPVVKIDDHVVGNGKPGKITSDIYKRFVELEYKFCKENKREFSGATAL